MLKSWPSGSAGGHRQAVRLCAYLDEYDVCCAEAYRLEANIGDWTGACRTAHGFLDLPSWSPEFLEAPRSSTSEQFKWVADRTRQAVASKIKGLLAAQVSLSFVRWFSSAQSVVKDFVCDL